MEDHINDVSILASDVKLLTKKEIAAEFGVTCRTIERWYANGYIKRIRVGGRIYFASTEVYRLRDQYIESASSGYEPLGDLTTSRFSLPEQPQSFRFGQ